MTDETKIELLKDIINGKIIHPDVRKEIGEWAVNALIERKEEKTKQNRWSKIIEKTGITK